MRSVAAVIVALMAATAANGDEAALLKALAKHRGFVIYDVCEIDRVSAGTHPDMPDHTILSTPQHAIAVDTKTLAGKAAAGDTMILLTKPDLVQVDGSTLFVWVILNGKNYSGINTNFSLPK